MTQRTETELRADLDRLVVEQEAARLQIRSLLITGSDTGTTRLKLASLSRSAEDARAGITAIIEERGCSLAEQIATEGDETAKTVIAEIDARILALLPPLSTAVSRQTLRGRRLVPLQRRRNRPADVFQR
jgi:hypothetical protein